MKKTISSNRLTIDLTDESKSILEKLKLTIQKPFGQIINLIISSVCNAPKDVKEETLSFYKRQIKSLYKQMDSASPYELQALSEKAQAYINLAMVMNGGKHITIDELNKEPEMVRYEIKGGYVICPKDWIVVNPDMAKQCYYAGVVECRRAEYKVPHFLFFTNKSRGEYDDILREEINLKCCEKWPEYRKILKQQVETVYDENGHALNYEEWDAAPTLGHFALYEHGDPTLPPNFKFPLGAKIVHTDKENL